MPEMSGLEATRHIRAALPATLPIIAVTGHSRDTEREACLAAGMNDFITKPFKGFTVLDVLVKHLA
jgi:CheY-like chemotaxis protein